MSFRRSAMGRVFGYGEFIVESAEQGQALRSVNFLPYPEQLYLQVCDLLFPDAVAETQHGSRPLAGLTLSSCQVACAENARPYARRPCGVIMSNACPNAAKVHASHIFAGVGKPSSVTHIGRAQLGPHRGPHALHRAHNPQVAAHRALCAASGSSRAAFKCSSYDALHRPHATATTLTDSDHDILQRIVPHLGQLRRHAHARKTCQALLDSTAVARAEAAAPVAMRAGRPGTYQQRLHLPVGATSATAAISSPPPARSAARRSTTRTGTTTSLRSST
jgi:hypothetical protein